jgi:hypothetical protein
MGEKPGERDIMATELLTAEMVKAARMLLRWEQIDLKEATKLALSTIQRVEQQRGLIDANAATIAVIKRAFQDNGIEFMRDGVRLVAPSRTLAPEELNASNDE